MCLTFDCTKLWETQLQYSRKIVTYQTLFPKISLRVLCTQYRLSPQSVGRQRVTAKSGRSLFTTAKARTINPDMKSNIPVPSVRTTFDKMGLHVSHNKTRTLQFYVSGRPSNSMLIWAHTKLLWYDVLANIFQQHNQKALSVLPRLTSQDLT